MASSLITKRFVGVTRSSIVSFRRPTVGTMVPFCPTNPRHFSIMSYFSDLFNRTRHMLNDIVRPTATPSDGTLDVPLIKHQDLSLPTSEATPPDGALAVPLLKHQRIALSWMVEKETNNRHCVGGFLADDQGLGKTISTIALILTERSPPSPYVGTTEVEMEKAETFNLYDVDQDDVTKHEKSNLKIETLIKVPLSGFLGGGFLEVLGSRPAKGLSGEADKESNITRRGFEEDILPLGCYCTTRPTNH